MAVESSRLRGRDAEVPSVGQARDLLWMEALKRRLGIQRCIHREAAGTSRALQAEIVYGRDLQLSQMGSEGVHNWKLLPCAAAVQQPDFWGAHLNIRKAE